MPNVTYARYLLDDGGDASEPPGSVSCGLSWRLGIAIALVAYATLCSALRFGRLRALQRRYPFPDRESLSRMTSEEAQAIVAHAIMYEFPLFTDLGSRFALLKTYSVKSIAKLLVAVSDLAKLEQAPKRYEDTEVIFACLVLFPPSSPDFHKAVARMNYLHAPYLASGKIRNEDMLYVLSTLMSEPIRFLRLYDWRPPTELEVAAQATFWKYIGDTMSIDYAAELGTTEWKDGLEFLDDVARWTRTYEEQHVGALAEVSRIGSALVNLMLSAYPKAVRPLGLQMLLVIMGDRMRYVFGLPEPSVAVSALTYLLLATRRLVVRYLTLPRLVPVRYVTKADARTGRMHHTHYLKEPWYTPATTWARCGPRAWLTRAAGGLLPGDPAMKPEGFLFEDIGPRHTMGKGGEETARMEARVREIATGRCPFAVT